MDFYFDGIQLPNVNFNDLSMFELLLYLDPTVYGCQVATLAQVSIIAATVRSLHNPDPALCEMYGYEISMLAGQYLNCPIDEDEDDPLNPGGEDPEDPWNPEDPEDPEDPWDPGEGEPEASIPGDAEMPYQDNPAIDPEDYLDCFRNISDVGATYKVTVYVQEPNPGSSAHIGTNGVGHVAIGMTKTGSNSQSITQVLGFYPVASKIYENISGPSKVVDNGNLMQTMQYTIKMVFDMGNDGGNFQNILNQLASPSSTYHILTDNCAKYVIEACVAGGLNVPHNPSVMSIALPGQPPIAFTAPFTPAGMAQKMREDKALGDSRINTANNELVPISQGSCN